MVGTYTTIVPDQSNNPQPKSVNTYERVPAMSAGVSLRVNVFGYFVVEPYLAYPFQRTDVSGPVFGVALAPGW